MDNSHYFSFLDIISKKNVFDEIDFSEESENLSSCFNGGSSQNDFSVSDQDLEENETSTEDVENKGYDNSDEPIFKNHDWQTKSKHVFILADSGKPIYSLHGSEDNLVAFMPMLVNLVSHVERDVDGNTLRHVVAGAHKFTFLHKSNLIVVNVSSDASVCVAQLELEAALCLAQLASVLTPRFLQRTLAARPGYDVRPKLAGSEKLLDALVVEQHTSSSLAMLTDCVEYVPLVREARANFARILNAHIGSLPYVVLASLVHNGQLVSMLQPKRGRVLARDVNLLLNAFAHIDHKAEFVWYPICLASFNPNAVLHVYMTALGHGVHAIAATSGCTEQRSHELKESCTQLGAELSRDGLMGKVAARTSDFAALRLARIGSPDLKHFVAKEVRLGQVYCSEWALPFSAFSEERRKRLLPSYQALYHMMDRRGHGEVRFVCVRRCGLTFVACATRTVQVLAAFSMLVAKDEAVRAMNCVLDFVEENRERVFVAKELRIRR